MSREIFILRHCKSDWDNNIHQDALRPLSVRGLRDGSAMGRWMHKQGLRPELVLCSTALRARQTIELVNESLQLPMDSIHFHDDLYLASLATLLNHLATTDLAYKSVMLVGHNPGLDSLVEYISRDPVALSKTGKLMSTGCLAHFACTDNWQALQQQGNLLSITRPADISNDK